LSIYIILFRPKPITGTFVILLSICILLIITYNWAELLIQFTPTWKESSAIIRLNNLVNVVFEIVSNPLLNTTYLNTGPTSFILDRALVIPLLGMALVVLIFKQLFSNLIKIFNNYKLFSSLMMGMLIVLSYFSNYGWTSLPGWTMLTLIYIRIDSLVQYNSK